MPYTCFSYSSDQPGVAGGGEVVDPCLTYPEVGPCFSYPVGAARRGLRRMPGYPCFSYQTDLPLSVRNRGAAAADVPRRPAGKPYPCFSYLA